MRTAGLLDVEVETVLNRHRLGPLILKIVGSLSREIERIDAGKAAALVG